MRNARYFRFRFQKSLISTRNTTNIIAVTHFHLLIAECIPIVVALVQCGGRCYACIGAHANWPYSSLFREAILILMSSNRDIRK